MRPSLTEPQIAALRQMAGLNDLRRRPWPQTLNALSAKGLGRVAARMNGWVPSEQQQALILALADGWVLGGARYDRGRGPSQVLRAFENRGIATSELRLIVGQCAWTASTLGHELAVDLRQQELPPLWGRSWGGGDEHVHA